MTDITELAQLRAELLSPAIGSSAHLRKIALSLVEALEKAQETIAFQQGEIKALLSSLEYRTVTVKLPPKIERDYVDGWFSHKGGLVGGRAAEWYNKALDDVIAELAAQGIKVEAE